MSDSLWRCTGCNTDVRFGDFHCVLCHATTPKGEQHKCSVIDAIVVPVEVTATVSVPSHLPRTPWPAKTYAAHEVPKE